MIMQDWHLLLSENLPTDEQQCQGLRQSNMKKVPCPQKAAELFLF